MTKLQQTRKPLRPQKLTASDRHFLAALPDSVQAEFALRAADGYDSVSDTLTLLQEFGGITDAEMVQAADLCLYDGYTIGQSVDRVVH